MLRGNQRRIQKVRFSSFLAGFWQIQKSQFRAPGTGFGLDLLFFGINFKVIPKDFGGQKDQVLLAVISAQALFSQL